MTKGFRLTFCKCPSLKKQAGSTCPPARMIVPSSSRQSALRGNEANLDATIEGSRYAPKHSKRMPHFVSLLKRANHGGRGAHQFRECGLRELHRSQSAGRATLDGRLIGEQHSRLVGRGCRVSNPRARNGSSLRIDRGDHLYKAQVDVAQALMNDGAGGMKPPLARIVTHCKTRTY